VLQYNLYSPSNGLIKNVLCSLGAMNYQISLDKPVGDRDHEVLGMGSFGEYNLYRNLVPARVHSVMYSWYQLHYKG
jgi:hypothetical protein